MSYNVSFEKLFERGSIGTMELKNRIIMSPMGTRLGGPWGEVTDDLIEWYVRRARGGVGLITIESTHAATAVDHIRYSTRMLRADDDSYFPDFSIHYYGKSYPRLSPKKISSPLIHFM